MHLCRTIIALALPTGSGEVYKTLQCKQNGGLELAWFQFEANLRKPQNYAPEKFGAIQYLCFAIFCILIRIKDLQAYNTR